MKTLIRLVLLLAVAGLAALGVASAARADTLVVPENPVWYQATCSQPLGSVDIPFGPAGVEYALDTIPGPGGNYQLGVGTHEVMALTFDGYVFPGGAHVVVFPDFTVVVPTGCGVTPPPPTHHRPPVPPGHHYGWNKGRHNPHRHLPPPPTWPRVSPPPGYCTPDFSVCTG